MWCRITPSAEETHFHGRTRWLQLNAGEVMATFSCLIDVHSSSLHACIPLITRNVLDVCMCVLFDRKFPNVWFYNVVALGATFEHNHYHCSELNLRWPRCVWYNVLFAGSSRCLLTFSLLEASCHLTITMFANISFERVVNSKFVCWPGVWFISWLHHFCRVCVMFWIFT